MAKECGSSCLEAGFGSLLPKWIFPKGQVVVKHLGEPSSKFFAANVVLDLLQGAEAAFEYFASKLL